MSLSSRVYFNYPFLNIPITLKQYKISFHEIFENVITIGNTLSKQRLIKIITSINGSKCEYSKTYK